MCLLWGGILRTWLLVSTPSLRKICKKISGFWQAAEKTPKTKKATLSDRLFVTANRSGDVW